MKTNITKRENNPLATGEIGKLILKFAVPAVISGLVSALYNIVDQIFIGRSVGLLGNGATNVAFPIVTFSLALALLLGVGSASNFSLESGRGDREKAMHIAGNGLAALVISGIALCILVVTFLQPFLHLFGATEDNLSYALSYTGITAIGIPFFIFGTGGSHLIRADGSPKYSMVSIASGAVLNCFLDPLFIFGFDMGIRGAALATIVGQILSAVLVFSYLLRFKARKFCRKDFRLQTVLLRQITSLGAAACFNQLAMAAVQIVLNNTLRSYGAQSVYGSDIPLACVGVISKVNVIYISIVVGISQGCQPIFGFNYGSKNYNRVKETYKKALVAVLFISAVAFLCFQLFPRQIVSIFGSGSEIYYQFSERYFRIYMMMVIFCGIQPLTSNFFSSIGKAKMGIIMALTRQIVFLIPLILLLPCVFGIDGVMYAGPIADGAAVILAVCFVWREMKRMGNSV